MRAHRRSERRQAHIIGGVTTSSPTALALEALEQWPKHRPLAALVSGPGAGTWSRRSIFAEPVETRLVRIPAGLDASSANRPLQHELRALLRRTPAVPSAHNGWIASISYNFGRVLEPKAHSEGGAMDDRDWPVAMLCWCPDALVLDHLTGAWTVVGDPSRVPSLPLLREAPVSDDRAPFSVGPLEPFVDRVMFEASVARCIELIHAGELFQANIARRISAPFHGSTRALAARAFAASGAWFGAYIEADPGRTIISMSPELFLSVDAATRRVVTRPIKGTRPEHTAPRELADSAKDAAELAMIVDLMRNDLGRVSEIGSVRVDSARQIETHPTVHHAVAEVSGTLRPNVDTTALLAATFPPGSVTGAPKIRAMQIIDELEPVQRGPYCGATGLFAGDGSVALNVSIRTIALSGRGHNESPAELDGTLDYWAGCGIVAESKPEDEWLESVAKTAVLMKAIAPSDD